MKSSPPSRLAMTAGPPDGGRLRRRPPRLRVFLAARFAAS